MGFLSKLAYQASRLWWSVTGPITVGVRVLLIQNGKVLLVRHTYQDRWYLVGGGVKRGETMERAIRREAAEEVGATLEHLDLFGVYTNFFEGKSDHVAVFVCSAFALSGQTDREIERFDFFDLDALPPQASPGTRRRIDEFNRGDTPYWGLW